MKPIIGITTFLEQRMIPNRHYNAVSHHYVRSVVMAGGVPVLIPIVDEAEDLSPYADLVDGFLFSGGEDLSPLLYGEDPLSQVAKFSDVRDTQELKLFQLAYERKMPILGICRGHQLINVALGGSLYQDLETQIPGVFGHAASENDVAQLYHRVQITAGSKLHALFGETELGVNSLHHQAVKDLGRDLVITARSNDGIVEAYETTRDQFLMGVQWHPEDLTVRHPHFRKLFEALVEAAGK